MRRALGWITANFLWKLLALVVAVVIWALVATEPELSAFASVPLEFRNLQDDLEISSQPVGTVSLELRGPSGALRNMAAAEPFGVASAARPAVILDMSDTRAGEHTFAIGRNNVRLPRGVRLVVAIPSEVRFEFEHRATRLVPVVPRFAGEGANGYIVAQANVEPRQLAIVGPASRVARVQNTVTDAVDVSNVVGPREYRINAYIADPYVRFEGSPEVTVSVVMKKK
jgi:YbbR domain-containing protein